MLLDIQEVFTKFMEVIPKTKFLLLLTLVIIPMNIIMAFWEVSSACLIYLVLQLINADFIKIVDIKAGSLVLQHQQAHLLLILISLLLIANSIQIMQNYQVVSYSLIMSKSTYI